MAHLLATVLLPAALLLGLALWALERARPGLPGGVLPARLAARLGMGLALVMLLVYGLALAVVALFPVALDAVEVTVASTASLVRHGAPLYTRLQDPARYSLLYGPLCTLPFAAGLTLPGGGLGTLKAMVVAFNVALLAVVWLTFRRVLDARGALVATAATASALLMKNMAVLLIRGDAALALAVALALFATSLGRRRAAALVFAAGAAWAVDIKFTAVFYLLLPLYFLVRRQGRAAAVAAVGLGGGLALLPFALPQVSLRNYLLWLQEAAHHPFGPKLLAMNVVEDVLLLAPAAVLLVAWMRVGWAERAGLADWADWAVARRFLRGHWLPAALLLLGLAGTTLAGSKVGAGRSHLNPDALLAFYAAALVWRRAQAALRLAPGLAPAFAVYALFLVVPAVSQLDDLWSICVRRQALASAVNADLTGLL